MTKKSPLCITKVGQALQAGGDGWKSMRQETEKSGQRPALPCLRGPVIYTQRSPNPSPSAAQLSDQGIILLPP